MNDKQFDSIFEIMEAAFPEYERRTYEGQKELLSNPHYRIITEMNSNNQIIAFLAVWEFPLFRFVEHIAVDSAIRGGGIGAKLMSMYIEESSTPIVLEVELPDTDLAQRRISFYERLGFQLNSYEHMQPPLQKGQPEVPLQIMSYPQTLTAEEWTLFKEVLYTSVYKVPSGKSEIREKND